MLNDVVLSLRTDKWPNNYINSDGRIYKSNGITEVKYYVHKSCGHRFVNIKKNNILHKISVATLVMETFSNILRPTDVNDGSCSIRHIDDNQMNDSFNNLTYVPDIYCTRKTQEANNIICDCLH